MCDEAHTDAVAPEEVTLEPVVTLEGGARPDGAGSTSDGASGGSSGTWGSSWFKGLKAPAGGGGTLGSLSLGGNLAQTWGASMRKGGEALRERMAAAVKDVQVGTSNNLEAASAHAAQLKGSLLTSFTGPTPQYVALRLRPQLPQAAYACVRVCAHAVQQMPRVVTAAVGKTKRSLLAPPHPPAGAIALVGCLPLPRGHATVQGPASSPSPQQASSLSLSGRAGRASQPQPQPARQRGDASLHIHSVLGPAKTLVATGTRTLTHATRAWRGGRCGYTQDGVRALQLVRRARGAHADGAAGAVSLQVPLSALSRRHTAVRQLAAWPGGRRLQR
jgi:hypothetical protein